MFNEEMRHIFMNWSAIGGLSSTSQQSTFFLCYQDFLDIQDLPWGHPLRVSGPSPLDTSKGYPYKTEPHPIGIYCRGNLAGTSIKLTTTLILVRCENPLSLDGRGMGRG